MANPIRPIGMSRDVDIFDEARIQDEQREARENLEHFNRTGENRRQVGTYDPLVDNDRYRDVANDGDSYDETAGSPFNNRNRVYSEDSPTQIIEQITRPQSSRSICLEKEKVKLKKEKIKEDNKINEMIDKGKNKFNKNIISGISLEE